MTTVKIDENVTASMRRNAWAVLPAPFIIGIILLGVVGAPSLVALLLGAAGWLLALALRQPVALVAMKSTTKERAATIVGWFSGPAEELVRLALVLLAIRSFEDAIWAGFGWATIEVLLVMVNGLAIASLVTKNDPKSIEARELLAAQGMLGTQHPLWGLLERISATALHMGFTLMLFAQPWLVLVTLPLHSATNMVMVRFVKGHLAWTEAVFAVMSAVVLVIGLQLTGL